MRMLIIDDDAELGEYLRLAFTEDAVAVDVVHDGEAGSYTARTNDYDIVVLDYSLPKKSGLQVCGEIRRAGRCMPIIMLSVIDSTTNKVELLSEGADDYVTKPFSIEELRARVKALLRRPTQISHEIFQIGDIILDSGKQTVMRNGKGLYLTRKEFGLLEYLMKHRGNVCSRGLIMEHVWNVTSDPFSNTIESHVLNLRKKLNSRGKKNLIVNVPGRGYKIS